MKTVIFYNNEAFVSKSTEITSFKDLVSEAYSAFSSYDTMMIELEDGSFVMFNKEAYRRSVVKFIKEEGDPD
jgi:hypothetical protein